MKAGALASARLRSVMESSAAGVAVVNAGGAVVGTNARWDAMRAAAGAGGVGDDWRALILPADHARLPRPADPPAEVRGVGPAGAMRWLAATLTAVEGDGGGAIVTLTDIDASKRDEAERAALHRVAGAVTRGEDAPHLFARVSEEVARLVGADGAGVAHFRGGDTGLMVGSWSGHPALDARVVRELPLHGEGTTARVFATGRPSRVDYVALNGPEGELPHPWTVSAAAPIRVDDRLWGALGVVSRRADGLCDDAEGRLERFADFVGIAVSNAAVREQLVRQASTDPLTDLPHHGAFHESLLEEVARSRRYMQPLSLAVIDIDHFKLVNDAHGHLTGDATLRALAELLRQHARGIDVIGRIGGEEFAWLMPQTAMPGARVAVERFRLAVGEAAFGAVSRLTVSAGVAAHDPEAGDPAELFRRADAALYRAKGAGRDRTMVSSGAHPA